METVIQVLTYKSVETILAVGGTQSWTVDRFRAKACKYAVCCRNAHAPDVESIEVHGSAFLVGKVADVVPSTDHDGRWLILFSEYALIAVRDQWEGRNPVRFYNVEDYAKSIDFENLEWESMPEALSLKEESITLALAKQRLAATFGVDPSAVEITIRG